MGATKTKYSLTPEHRAQLKPWTDQWIANAMSTKAMDEKDRAATREAVKGLYRAAGMAPPPDHRIVFVPSPFVMRFAGGFAAWIWYCRGRKTITHDSTSVATSAATSDATIAATSVATSDATIDATSVATRAATDAATRAATDAATHDATIDATIAATSVATIAATRAATDAATHDATSVATSVATIAATRDVTDAATHDATRAATDAATSDATIDATIDATSVATRAATDAATRDATDDATDDAWYRGIGDMGSVARRFTGDTNAMLRCAQLVYHMWNGGNQWSGWVAYLSFFRHVAKLNLDYSKWEHYEAAAIHSGPRIMHQEFCLISDRPEILTVDDQNRPHNVDGPFCRWRDGTALYAVHGVRVPWWIVEHPDRITVDAIGNETNAEVRRVMIERYGQARYIQDIGAEKIHEDDFGVLYRVELQGDDPLVMVKVVNTTPNADGTYRDYFLPVHHELRPLPPPRMSVEAQRVWYESHLPQAMTARNGVASTFGCRGEEYRPAVES